MISVKDYARTRGISPEAVRRQLIRYQKELSGHVITKGRAKLLDETAVEFLDGHRMQRTVTIAPTDPETQKIIDDLQKAVTDLQGKLNESNNVIIELQRDQAALLEAKIHNKYLIADNVRLEDESKRLRDELEDARIKTAVAEAGAEEAEEKIKMLKQTNENQQEELNRARAEADSFQKSIFGFYRKKK